MGSMESGSFFNRVPKLISQVYAPGFNNAQKRYSQGENLTGMIILAQQVNKLPLIKEHFNTTKKVFHNLSNSLPSLGEKINNLDELATNPSFKAVYNPLYQTNKHGAKITEFGFFRYTFTEEKMKNSAFGRMLLGMDKNLTDFKFIQDGFSKIFKGCQIKSVVKNGAAEKYVAGINGAKTSTSAALTAKALGRIPVLNIALSALFELPAVVRSFKNGDGLKQVGRSAINITGYTAGSALLGAAMTALLPPLGGIIGASIGVFIGGKIANKVGNFIFGKPPEKPRDNFFSHNLPYYYPLTK
ncbi:MAG: hypothetical protein A2104_07885 [Candidatus Melainabacteria bacterium GWF2_32_7]|nr:MAG: hypothetical protein A2104_07885 [Candidatus Melainabacteria bacterium GWF2_32_7]